MNIHYVIWRSFAKVGAGWGGKGEEEQWLLENLFWIWWIFFLTQNIYLTGKWKVGFFIPLIVYFLFTMGSSWLCKNCQGPANDNPSICIPSGLWTYELARGHDIITAWWRFQNGSNSSSNFAWMVSEVLLELSMLGTRKCYFHPNKTGRCSIFYLFLWKVRKMKRPIKLYLNQPFKFTGAETTTPSPPPFSFPQKYLTSCKTLVGGLIQDCGVSIT